MLYVKNVPGWERVLRVLSGMASLAFAAMNWGVSGIAVAVGVMGAALAMSGLMGYCPMCAMAGRRPVKGR